jgi:hypothetical protein
MKLKRMTRAEHVEHISKKRNTYRVSMGRSVGNRQPEKPRHR